MRKLLRSRKGLSPVIAAIILIAVTVAVSIAVAAWMGALTIGFFGGAEQLRILEVRFPGTNMTTVEVSNTGGSDIVITEVRVDGESYYYDGSANWAVTSTTNTYTVEKGTSGTLTVNFDWAPGITYNIHVKTTKQLFGPYPATAPT